MSFTHLALSALIVVTSSAVVGQTPCAPVWSAAPFGATSVDTDGAIYAMVVADDGGGPGLFVGGDFTVIGGVAANRAAVYRGGVWSPLGLGIANGSVYAVEAYDDGSGTAVYFGGSFVNAGGGSASRIAKWDGVAWSALGTGVSGGFNTVDGLRTFDDGAGPRLFVGGSFTVAGGVAANRVAKWNGAAWSAVGSGMNSYVWDFAVHDEGFGPRLFACGPFSVAGGVACNRVARWDGAAWSAVGTGTSGGGWGSPYTLRSHQGLLFAGGDFLVAGGAAASRIAQWNGLSWSAVGSGVSAPVEAFATFDSGAGTELILAGGFTTAGGSPASRIASWNGSSFSPLGAGVGHYAASAAVFDDGNGPALFVGGSFNTAGGAPASYGATWSAIAPVVSSEPSPVVAFVGTPASFSVGATGPNLAYQWRKDGAPISGAVGNSLSFASVTDADNGAYDVVVTNACGSVASTPARLQAVSTILSIAQPGGSGSISIVNTLGPANLGYFTMLSFDAANASDTGGGPWYGFYMDYGDLLTQLMSSAPPFVGYLDGAGGSAFYLPAGTISSLAGYALFGETLIVDWATPSVLGRSAVVGLQLY
jgi:hypothetical protein